MSDKKEIFKTIVKVILVFVCLYFFLVSIGLMGKAFKGFGKPFAEQLLATTSNPLVGLFIGILSTSIIQSSSTTTSIVVGIVASGVITIGNAVPIIMGANIGTTVTNTLVSLGHITRKEEFKRAIAGATIHDFFNLICVGIMFPLELATGFLQKTATVLAGLFANAGGIKFTSPIKMATKPMIGFIKHFLLKTLALPHNAGYGVMIVISIVFLFFSMFFIVKLMKSMVMKKTETVLDNIIGERGLIGIFAGLFLTIIVQSSSITTSLVVPMAGAGLLTLIQIFPYTLGANIGTTVTAILAALITGNIAAVTVAFTHLLFNISGIVFWWPLKKVPIFLAQKFAEYSTRSKLIPVAYVVILFFIIPVLVIYIVN